MKIRSIPDLQGFMALKGRIIVDTYRGQVRIRSWPRKQSAETKRKNGNQIRWFKAAREMAKWAEPSQINLAKDVVKGTGLYPGDLQMMAAAGNLIPVIFNDPVNYTKWQPRIDPVSFQGIRAPLEANQTLVVNLRIVAVWGLPDFQTTEFWTPGDPTHYVIPQGVTKVAVMTSTKLTTNSAPFAFTEIDFNDGLAINLTQVGNTTGGRALCATGPITVTGGNTFSVNVFSSIAGILDKNSVTWFTLEVLETDV